MTHQGASAVFVIHEVAGVRGRATQRWTKLIGPIF
jgi:hypothetical protein